MSDSLRLGVRKGLQKAKELGAQGVQIGAVSGEMAPENLSPDKRKELRKYLEDLGLELSALCGELGGFTTPDANPAKIERSRAIMDLAGDLGTSIVTAHIGALTADETADQWKTLQDACSQLAEYAESAGVYYAVETGPEPAKVLRRFLDSLPGKAMCVNYDPANLVMVSGDDPVAGVYELKDYIVHTHAKDGLMKTDDGRIYEKPLGKGDVDFDRYIAALDDVGYSGYLTIEREVGENPEEDIKESVLYLKRILQGR